MRMGREFIMRGEVWAVVLVRMRLLLFPAAIFALFSNCLVNIFQIIISIKSLLLSI